MSAARTPAKVQPLDQVRNDWTRLVEDPLWAVLIRPGPGTAAGTRPSSSPPGDEVDTALAHLRALDALPRLDRALRLRLRCRARVAGSRPARVGTGRRGRSAPMLEAARRLDRSRALHVRAERAAGPVPVRRRQLRPRVLQPRAAAPAAGAGPQLPRRAGTAARRRDGGPGRDPADGQRQGRAVPIRAAAATPVRPAAHPGYPAPMRMHPMSTNDFSRRSAGMTVGRWTPAEDNAPAATGYTTGTRTPSRAGRR